MQIIKLKVIHDDKPGKDEKVTFFRVCKQGCPECDTKRMSGRCRR